MRPFPLRFEIMIRVVLADDHPIVRAGIRMLLNQNADICIAGEAQTAAGVLDVLQRVQADVLLLDAVLPGMRAKALVQTLHRQYPDLPILVLSAYKDPHLVMGLLQAGASGYLVKGEDMEDIARAIYDVRRGKRPLSAEIVTLLQQAAIGDVSPAAETSLASLTSREREVLDLMGEGLSNEDIAQRLYISERTVKFHAGNIYSKLGARNRTEAILLLLKSRTE